MLLLLFLASAWTIRAILASESAHSLFSINLGVEAPPLALLSQPASTPAESMAPALTQLSTSLNQWDRCGAAKSLPATEPAAKD